MTFFYLFKSVTLQIMPVRETVASFGSLSVPLTVGYTHQKCVGLLKGTGIKKQNVSIKKTL